MGTPVSDMDRIIDQISLGSSGNTPLKVTSSTDDDGTDLENVGDGENSVPL